MTVSQLKGFSDMDTCQLETGLKSPNNFTKLIEQPSESNNS